MAKITVKNKEYNMRFNLAFWERIYELHGITQQNLEEKLNDDFGKVASGMVQYGIFYGIPLSDRPASVDELDFTLEDLKNDLDASVADIIEATIIEGMTKAQRDVAQKIKDLRDKKISELTENSGKKK